MTARDRLVYSTIELVRRHGVTGAGVAEILEHSDVSRRSIYLNFPDGKTGLVAEATRVAGDFIGGQITTFVALPAPRDALAAFIREWMNVVEQSDFSAGCPVTAAALSRSSTPSVADLAAGAFEQWTQTICGSLREHGLTESAAMALANTMIAAVEGAVIMCIAQRSLSALEDVGSQLEILIEHHLAATRGPDR